jgi:hypothetical protein
MRFIKSAAGPPHLHRHHRLLRRRLGHLDRRAVRQPTRESQDRSEIREKAEENVNEKMPIICLPFIFLMHSISKINKVDDWNLNGINL